MGIMTSGFMHESAIDSALNFKHNNYLKVGHGPKLSMSKKPLKADFNIKNPSNEANYNPNACLPTYFYWNKEAGGVIEVRGVVTEANSGLVQHSISDAKGSNAEVDFLPELWKYHKDKDLYFLTLHTDGKPLKCTLLLSNEYPSKIDPDPSEDYGQMALYPFVLYLIARENAGRQKINIDYDTEIKLSLDFGQDKKPG